MRRLNHKVEEAIKQAIAVAKTEGVDGVVAVLYFLQSAYLIDADLELARHIKPWGVEKMKRVEESLAFLRN